MLNSQGLMVVFVPLFLPRRWQIFPPGCSMIFDCPVDRSWCAQRCCDGAATESLLWRRCADQLRRAHSARRVRDAADAAATELMLRAALLRRSCAGVAAAPEQRRTAPSRSFCASRRDATRWMRSQHHFPFCWFKFQVVAHSPRPPPWPRNCDIIDHR